MTDDTSSSGTGDARSERGMDNYTIEPETGCWIWQGSRDATGYAYRVSKGKRVSVRRWQYEQRFGPIPEGLRLSATCENALCVNPEHMTPVAPREIVRRGPIAKLDMAQAREIRALAGQLSQHEIAASFGISTAQVNNVLKGKVWRDDADDAESVTYARKYGRLTFADAERIRDLAQTRTGREIAAEYGVSESTISRIVSGSRWANPPVTTVHTAARTDDPTSHPDREPAQQDDMTETDERL